MTSTSATSIKASVIFAMGRQGLVGPAGSQTTNVAPLPYLYAKNYAPISKVVILEDTYVINNNLVNQFKWGAAQYHSPDNNPTYGIPEFAASAAGITNLPTGQASGSFPYEKFTGGPQTFAPWGPQSGYVGNTNAFTLLDNVQWIKGRHSFTFGGQVEWMEYNYVYCRHRQHHRHAELRPERNGAGERRFGGGEDQHWPCPTQATCSVPWTRAATRSTRRLRRKPDRATVPLPCMPMTTGR